MVSFSRVVKAHNSQIFLAQERVLLPDINTTTQQVILEQKLNRMSMSMRVLFLFFACLSIPINAENAKVSFNKTF